MFNRLKSATQSFSLYRQRKSNTGLSLYNEGFIPTFCPFSRRVKSLFFQTVFVTSISISTAVADENLGPALKPNLGQPAPDYIGSVVSPDGSGLPAGKGTVVAGKAIYDAQCAACHGPDGKLAANPLAGGLGSLSSAKPLKTVGSYWPYATTLYDYIARAMPYNQPKSLSANDVYAVTAYILKLNGIVHKETTLDSSSIVNIKMPNRGGFFELQE